MTKHMKFQDRTVKICTPIVDGWADGWTDGRTDGWTDVSDIV